MSTYRFLARGNPARNQAPHLPRTAASTTNDLDSPTTERQKCAFVTLRKALAIKGFALFRTDPNDGPVTYWAERFGVVRMFSTLDEIQPFLNGLEDLS